MPVEREVTALENGHSFIMRVLPYRTTGGKIDGIVVTLIDISTRKQAEEDQARLAALVESSDDAIIAKDLNGIILSWNAGSEHLFGYRADEVIGKSITLLLPPELREEEDKLLQAAFGRHQGRTIRDGAADQGWAESRCIGDRLSHKG